MDSLASFRLFLGTFALSLDLLFLIIFLLPEAVSWFLNHAFRFTLFYCNLLTKNVSVNLLEENMVICFEDQDSGRCLKGIPSGHKKYITKMYVRLCLAVIV